MRILCLTNFYPPHEIGGEEQSCHDVVQALKARGHTVAVLTSTHGFRGKQKPERGVCRELHLEMEIGSPLHPVRFFLTRRQRERQSLARLQEMVQQFDPEVIFIWGMWNLPRSLPALVESLRPGRVLYRFADYWPTLPSQHEFYWQAPGRYWLTRPLKKALGSLALTRLNRELTPVLRFEHAYCISAAMRQELVKKGVPVEHARIIHNGVDTERFRPRPNIQAGTDNRKGLALLYAGRIVEEKGVHAAVEAMACLAQRRGADQVTLTLVGPASPEYYARLQMLVSQYGLDSCVSFRSPAPKEAMPALLREYDVLLFPPIWPEPFGRILIEAMASGLAVICTPVGGVPEIVTDERDGLFFAPEDAEGLASQIERLLRDPSLRYRLAQAARRTVEERFSLSRMVDQVEAYLEEIACTPPEEVIERERTSD